MKRTVYIVLASLSLIPALCPAEEQIQLPDVTTTVSGDSLTAGKNAIPDFSSLLPDTANAPLPKLPGAKSESLPQEPEAAISYESDKAIYAEGLIGGGYPGFFSGDFSIYKSSGDSPFSLRFSHESENGYGVHTAADGFSDSKTALSGAKKITFKQSVLTLGASYDTQSYGMQSVSPCFFNTTQQTIGTKDSVLWNLPKGFSIILGTDGSWYSRYAGIVPAAPAVYALQEKEASLLSVNPELVFAWSAEQDDGHGFKMTLRSSYSLETFLTETEATSGTTTHRGEFGIAASWSNNTITAGAKVSIVVGNAIGSAPVIAPFAISFATHFKQGESERQVVISGEGGLDSYLPQYEDLEKKYAWATSDVLASETSDWYGLVKASVPIASLFSFDASGTFRKPAFENGVWEPAYTTATGSGMYRFTATDRTLVDTDFGFSFLYKRFTLSADWKSSWLYVPVTESEYSIGVTGGMQSETGFWGTSVGVRESLGNGADAVPEISASGFYRLTDSLKLALELNDAAKLFSGKDRAYAGTNYLRRAGNVKILVKFFF